MPTLRINFFVENGQEGTSHSGPGLDSVPRNRGEILDYLQ